MTRSQICHTAFLAKPGAGCGIITRVNRMRSKTHVLTRSNKKKTLTERR